MSHYAKQPIWTLLIICGVLLTLTLFLNGRNGATTSYQTQHVITLEGSKWIVICSSENIAQQALLSFSNWTIVVVEDNNSTIDSMTSQRIHFLSAADQYRMATELSIDKVFYEANPKVLGTLYAIQHGAKWILDSDITTDLQETDLGRFDWNEVSSGLRYQPRTYENILLDPSSIFDTSENAVDRDDRMLLCRSMKTSAVQHGIMSGGPSQISKYAPPITFGSGLFAHWTARNTLFQKSSFLTILPLKTSQETATWRPLLIQKIIHLIGESVTYHPFNIKTPGLANKWVLNKSTASLANFLFKWSCQQVDLYECILKLAADLRDQSFLTPTDLTGIQFWIHGLKQIGYDFPSVKEEFNYTAAGETELLGNCRKANLQLENNSADKDNFPLAARKINGFNEILKWCGQADKKYTDQMLPSTEELARRHSNDLNLRNKSETVLIILNNYPWKQSIGLLQRLYAPYFASLIFCGSWNPSKYNRNESFPRMQNPFSFIHLNAKEMHLGYFGYYCLSKVREMRIPNVKGYFVMGDDVTFNVWVPNDVSRTLGPDHAKKPEIPVSAGTGWWKWRHRIVGESAAERIVALVRGKYVNDSSVQATWSSFTQRLRLRGNPHDASSHMLAHTGECAPDFYYVSSSHFDYVAKLFEIFNEGRLFLATAITKMLYSLDYDRSSTLKYLWTDEERVNWPSVYNANITMLHPIKLSYFETELDDRKTFCQTVISTFAEQLYFIS